MMQTYSFTPRLLSASEYALALHRPEDQVALLLRNRPHGQIMQRIPAAETVASPAFQDWLRERSESGADIFLGMNPLRHNSYARTKECVLEIRHVYLDLDEDGPASLHAIRTTGAATIGLGFTLPANSAESVMDKFGRVFGAEELAAVSL